MNQNSRSCPKNVTLDSNSHIRKLFRQEFFYSKHNKNLQSQVLQNFEIVVGFNSISNNRIQTLQSIPISCEIPDTLLASNPFAHLEHFHHQTMSSLSLTKRSLVFGSLVFFPSPKWWRFEVNPPLHQITHKP